MENKTILEALKKLRANEKRKFPQTVDLIINLKNFDIKRESVNLFLNLPHKIKEIKVAAFLDKKSGIIDSITKPEFERYKDKRVIKKLVKNYDFFMASASLMPAIASAFGRYLGSAGKMPSPQLGIIKEELDSEIKKVVEKMEKTIKVKSKEPSLKFAIGNENMRDEDIAENIILAYNTILNSLSKKKENIKSIMLKFTMTKPIKLEDQKNEEVKK
ncbi:hypothetical protein HYW76_03540 [Candidatus Pacearchaeota archaeon]|nr:hypothetical protein [Candidatus Pacearchaeota archaeon]